MDRSVSPTSTARDSSASAANWPYDQIANANPGMTKNANKASESRAR